MIDTAAISHIKTILYIRTISHIKTISLRAQITVMAAMVFMIVVSFVTTCVDSAAMSGYNTIIKQSCSLSDESVFAAYSNDLLEQFDIFALKKSDIINEKIPQYIKENIKTYSKDLSLTEASYTGYKYMTDNGGYGVEEQIIKYMKSGGYADVVKNYNAVNNRIKESDAVRRVTEAICSTQAAAGESSSVMSLLINTCSDMDEKENEISSMVAECKKNMDELYYMYEAADVNILSKYSRKIERISDEIHNISQDILYQASSYEELRTKSEQSIRECHEKLNFNRSDISDELYQELSEDIDRLYTEYGDADVLSEGYIRDSVDNDNSIIENIVGNMQAVQDICMKISEPDVEKQEYITKIEKIYEDIESEINGFSIKTIVQEYEQYTFRADDYNTSITSLNKIYQMLKEGAAGLVIDGEISDKSMDYSDLADTCVSGSYGGDCISNIDIRQALVSEYIISRYACYTDYIEKNGQQTGYIEKKDRAAGRLLDYEIEYILCGRQSDKDNLNEVIFKLVLIREGLNLSYLVTDVQKKNECFGLALQLLGYTGNMVLIKAAQYFIMSIWAYAESVMELRELYAGESIATVKNADNWITDINTVISSGAAGLKTSLFSDKNKTGKETGSTAGYNSLDYMDYMRILLLIKDRTARNAGIMSAMEMVMIALGHEDFRMKEYIYEASGTAVFIYVKNGQTYSQKLEYSYI